MKVYEKLLIWAAVSIFLQLIALWFINDVYIKSRGRVIEVTPYEENGGKPVSKDIGPSIDITKLSMSYDGSFAGYIFNGCLKIIDLKGGNTDNSIKKGDKNISYYRWLPDRNMVVYTFAEYSNGRSQIHIETFDAETAATREYPGINELGKGLMVKAIESSSYTNTVYVAIRSSDGYDRLYKYDIMENLTCIATMKSIFAIRHMIFSDKLIYQTGENKIFVMNGTAKGSAIGLNCSEGYILLGSDLKGNIYLGRNDNQNNIREILFGRSTDNFERDIKRIVMKGGIKPSEIHVTQEGRIFTVSRGKKMVLDVFNNSKTNYPGEFVQIVQKYVISYESGRLIFSKLADLK